MIRVSKLLVVTMIIFGIVAFTSSATMASDPEYVGWKGCAVCHRDEARDWSRSKHAKAWELLKPGKRRSAKKHAGLDPEKDYQTTKEKCVKCHTTGYRKPGGFQDTKTTPEMVGIQCEMCHGPGSEYRKIHKAKRANFTKAEVKAAGQTYGSVDETVCRKCHENKDSPMLPSVDKKYKFVLEERLKIHRAFHKFYPLVGKHE